MVRPLCKCHGEPMVRNGLQPVTRNLKWQCSIGNRKRVAAWHDNLDGVSYNLRIFKQRRFHALKRMAKRAAA